MIFRTAVTLLLSAVATQLVAAPLDESKIQFIGPLGTQSTIKPHNTPHQKSIINNLLPQLQKPNQKLEVFGNTRSWQSLEQVNALTVNGM
ncbi:S9 family peptidase, partial [Pseudoalteromonas ruthenica]